MVCTLASKGQRTTSDVGQDDLRSEEAGSEALKILYN